MFWTIFIGIILIVLFLDLKVFHRDAREIQLGEALLWSVFWIALALLFNAAIWKWKGSEAAGLFFTSYLIEKSLSLDNIFVFYLIFRAFNVPAENQYRVLFWGVLGALVMRALFIAAGLTLVSQFEWMIYIFGLFLIWTGVHMFKGKDMKIEPGKNWAVRWYKKHFRVTDQYADGKFFVRVNNQIWATPLFVALLVVESTDVVFALDSIPAVMAITLDPFIVYTSNIFAILGLRALYFVVARMIQKFELMHYGLTAILIFVGLKMLVSGVWHIPIFCSLGVISLSLLIPIICSFFVRKESSRKS